MARLIITGDRKQLDIIIKQNTLRAIKYDIIMKYDDDVVSEPEQEHEFNVKTILKMMNEAQTIEELKKYDGDDRKTIQKEYERLMKKFQ